MKARRRRPLWAMGLALLFGACRDDGVSGERERERKLFDRYVALGNSITAGYESGGINDSTQAHAYPALLAARRSAPFVTVRLRRPGCPAPLVGPFVLTRERVGGGSTPSCAGVEGTPSGAIQNLAFPGLKIGDVASAPGGPLGLIYAQLLGGRTVLQTMTAARPTLVSVWLGNNDVLSAATSGDASSGRLTPVAQFEASLASIVDAVRAARVRDAVLIGVVNPLVAPIVQPGAYLWLARQDPGLSGMIRKPVNGNCAPTTAGGQPNPAAINLVSLEVVDVGPAEISCADDAPYVLTGAEQALIGSRVDDFNRALRTQAEANGWIYLDPNAVIQRHIGDPSQIRRCQGLEAARTPQQLQAAVAGTCPHRSAPNFFGALISFDAVHPSAAGHRLIADALEAALRARHPAEL